MSQFVVYLKVKPLIAQWLAFHYGTPVRFPDQSAENACIRRFLTRQPGGIPKMQGEGEVGSASQTQSRSRSSHTTISALTHELHWSIASKTLSDYSCGTTLMGSRHCAALCLRLCVRGARIMASASTTRIPSRCVFSACALLTSSRALTCDARQEKKTTDFSVKISINHNDKKACFVHGRSKPFKCSKL